MGSSDYTSAPGPGPQWELQNGDTQVLNLVVGPEEGAPATKSNKSKRKSRAPLTTNPTYLESQSKGPGRLDRWLALQCPTLTRSTLKKIIAGGGVEVNGQTARPSRSLRPGDRVKIVAPVPKARGVYPQPILVPIVYEDEHLVVVDKPAGLSVHPGSGHPDGTLVNALLHHCKGSLAQTGDPLRPGIVHRLDMDTSGLMVVAKTEKAYQALVNGFKEGAVERKYLAVVRKGSRRQSLQVELPSEGTFRTLYGRHPTSRMRFTTKVQEGKKAITEYRVLERLEQGCLVEATLRTGRTHQIRVHFYEAGFPLFGDHVYTWGNLRRKNNHARTLHTPKSVTPPSPEQPTAPPSASPPPAPDKPRSPNRRPTLADRNLGMGRQALHAWYLAFKHPVTGEPMEFRGDPPGDFMALLEMMGKGRGV